jgi:very-short-patch-repair endonuclease
MAAMAEGRKIVPAVGAQSCVLHFDRAISELAGRQHGVVSRWQLLELGLGRRAIQVRIEAGRLHPIHRGVYAVGHKRLAREGHWMAAVLACGPGAVLSGRTAAALWGIRPYSGRIEIVAPGPRRHSAAFIARRSSLPPDEITETAGLPATTPARTILDLAAVLEDHQLDKAIREADYRRILDMSELNRLIDRHPTCKGRASLRKALATAALGMSTTRSELEDRFRALLLTANLPRPTLNATIELNTTTIEVDALWKSHGLIAELDGHAAHASATAFEADRLRDRRLAAAGYTVLRITWRQLTQAPNQVLADLSACIGRLSDRPRAAAPRA